jgi:hypothetical protein
MARLFRCMVRQHIMNTTSTLRSFRQITRRFVNGEEQQHFVSELLLFAILFVVSAWPVFQLAEAISTALK